ncbi:metal ABC transporter permease [Aerosakkonema funiforme]|uniref:Metal ABC transporter permease n=1 Tax=Aerosakkonema funiforme FACHB-1375 TaxID=2949571 RepID=A0A926VHT6_9CYAN|nr:metal ABC transporter permease [Aerosakkonema funiforme]MBD2184037.1 metal ABC transporter permease [Aerosakkonema funiforme FACHB-1375]
MWNFLIEPLSFEFMRHALAIAILLGILCSVVGSFLIVQQMGMMGDAIAHSVLPGLSIAFFLGIDISIGAFIAGTLSALLVAWIRSQSRIKVDVAMALVLSSFLALGVTLIKILKTNKLDLHNILFGDILGVTITDVWHTLAIAVTILVLVKLFYKELLFYTFDPLGAQASGLAVTWIYLGLIAAITLTVIASMQTVGVLLIISLLIGPGISGYLLVKELHLMMGVGAVIGIIASISGMYLSYYWDIPSGPAIVLVVFGLFLLTLLFSPSQGILTRRSVANRSAKIIQQLNYLKRR